MSRLPSLLLFLTLVAAACGEEAQFRAPTPGDGSTTTTTAEPADDGETVDEAEADDGETVAITALEVGMCSDTPDVDTAGGRLSLVDCSQPHRYEVYAAVPATAFVDVDRRSWPETAATACDLTATEVTGLLLESSSVDLVAIPPTAAGEEGRCVFEAPNQRVDFFTPLGFATPADIGVDKLQLPGSSDTSFQVAQSVVTDGDQVVLIAGADTSTDPSANDDNDANVWRSSDGGQIFSRLTDGSLVAVSGNQVPLEIDSVPGAYLMVGLEFFDDSTEPLAWLGSSTGLSWARLAVPLGDAVGGEIRDIVFRGDDVVELIGSVVDTQSRARPVVWTWTGVSLAGPVSISETAETGLGQDFFLENVFPEGDSVIVQATDRFTNVRSSWRSDEPGVWVRQGGGGLNQRSQATTSEGTYAVRGGEFVFLGDQGGWTPVALPGHDGGVAAVRNVAARGDDVLVAGTMGSVRGSTAALWLKRAGATEFELVYFDLDSTQRAETILDATGYASGFVVTGSESSDAAAGAPVSAVVWTVTVP